MYMGTYVCIWGTSTRAWLWDVWKQWEFDHTCTLMVWTPQFDHKIWPWQLDHLSILPLRMDHHNLAITMWSSQWQSHFYNHNLTTIIWPLQFDHYNLTTTIWPSQFDQYNFTITILQSHFYNHNFLITIWPSQFDHHNLTTTIWPPQFGHHNLATTIWPLQFDHHNLTITIWPPQFAAWNTECPGASLRAVSVSRQSDQEHKRIYLIHLHISYTKRRDQKEFYLIRGEQIPAVQLCL